MPTWRDRLRPVIAQALQDTKGKSAIEITRAIRKAYPLTERKYWPYKVWLHEVHWQRFGKWKRQSRARKEPKWKSAQEQQRLEEWETIYGKRES